jgi:type II secretory ATPase GspE/PulE/Tfp pilus assembly ATPase PilB-like protein
MSQGGYGNADDRPDNGLSLDLDAERSGPREVVDRLIEHAAGMRASDLFLCTNEGSVAILARHLGMLRRVAVLPADLGRHCIYHVKTMAGMDATVRRHPLDGRWVHERPGGGVLDLRIETVPTLYGEDLALRILDRHSRLLALDNLGLHPGELQEVRKLLQGPGGLILVTGPTGSGKTTTLYACLCYLNNGERKIHTIEDPVEYVLPGIRQSQVNHRIGLDFPELLRAVLRQGPDVIMLGEVRDRVTAQTAVRAANSGQLVLATLHAPGAAGTVQSMLSLGVHPHHLANSLRAAVAQRLIRTLCSACKQPTGPPAPAVLDETAPWRQSDQVEVCYRPGGCPACHHTGYADRTGLFEVLSVRAPVRRLILQGASSQAIHEAAVKDGVLPFRPSALLKVVAGETSLEEVSRVVPARYVSDD